MSPRMGRPMMASWKGVMLEVDTSTKAPHAWLQICGRGTGRRGIDEGGGEGEGVR
jgi:hypothetical protein